MSQELAWTFADGSIYVIYSLVEIAEAMKHLWPIPGTHEPPLKSLLYPRAVVRWNIHQHALHWRYEVIHEYSTRSARVSTCLHVFVCVYGQKGIDISPVAAALVCSGSAQRDLLLPCLSDMAPPEASQMLGENEEAPVEGRGKESTSKSDKVKRVLTSFHVLEYLFFLVFLACLPRFCRGLLMHASLFA